MANFKLLWNNQADKATLSGGSWQAGLPITNVQEPLIQKVARSTNVLTASTQLDLDFGVGKAKFQSVILINYGVTPTATIRIRIGDDPTFAVTLHDTGFYNIYDTIFPAQSITWPNPNLWVGQEKNNDIEGYTRNLIVLLNAEIEARYIRIEIDDSASTEGFVDIGRLFVAPVLELNLNMNYGASLGWNDPSQVAKSIGGTPFYDKRSLSRTHKFSTDYLSQDEALSKIFELQRRNGITAEVFIIPDSADTDNQFRTSFLGRLTKLNPLSHYRHQLFKTKYDIEEIL